MSNPPIPPAPGGPPGYDPTLQYGNPAPKLSGMAITAMVLGIAAFPLMCIFGTGIVAAILAIVFGIVGLVSINKTPDRLGGKGFAIAGIVLGAVSFVVVIPLLIAILLPSLGKARELSNRSVCAANLRGTMQSMNVYAADNNDAYPIISPRGGYSLAAGGTGTPAANPDDTIRSMYRAPEPSIPQNAWLLVLTGQVAPKQYVCKSDPASGVSANATTPAGQYFVNFNNGTGPSDLSYSYSFAYPWTQTPPPAGQPHNIGGWWRNATDASLPLMADMAPLSGTGSPASTPASYATRNANSLIHQRDGQNVGYGDAHAEFCRTPAIGQMNDNIFTTGGGTPTSSGTQMAGTVPPIGNGGAMGAWDIYMVPAADSGTHVRR